METIFQHLEMADHQCENLQLIWEMAVTEERNRLAREIHDTLVQSFAGIVLHTEALGIFLGANDSRSQRALLSIQKLARSGLDEARRSVQALRPKAMEGYTLSQALMQAAEHFSTDAQLACNFKQRGRPLPLPADVQNETFRIAQEAMTNVQKHARAKSVWVTLEFKAHQMILTIQDDGIGFAAVNALWSRCGYGMTSMRERARRIGGRLKIESPATCGTLIRVEMPLAENGENDNYAEPNETVEN
jgi:signal transduction histidine kinase